MVDDYGTRATEKAIKDLDARIVSIYREAANDIQAKMDEFTRKYRVKEAIYRKKLNRGEITQDDYDDWVRGQIFQSKQWKLKKEEIERILTNANKLATDIINEKSSDVFSTNANYMSYSIEHGAGCNFGFTLYDRTAVVRLIKDDPKVLPEWKIDEPKDYVWNGKKVNRQIALGIIEGESLDKIAKRLADNLSSQNFNHMRTFARTAMTGAQNAGRDVSLTRARDMGIRVFKEWMATLDHHTRDSHRRLDGERVPVQRSGREVRKFSNGLRYPADPEGPAKEVYNCRCTLVGDLADFPSEYQRYDNIDGVPIKNMTYQEWFRTKQSLKTAGTFQSRLGAATTVQEVNDLINSQVWFKDVYGTLKDANLNGCDLDSAKKIAEAYYEVFDRFPQLKGRIDAPDAHPVGMRDNTYAWCYTRHGGRVQVNPKWFGNWDRVKRSYEHDVRQGYHPVGTSAESIIIHELGHAIDGLLARERILGGYTSGGEFRHASSSLKTTIMKRALKVDENLADTYDSWWDKKYGMGEVIRQGVSEYATKNGKEWFAECFAEYMTSDDPRTVARLFGEELEKLIGRLS